MWTCKTLKMTNWCQHVDKTIELGSTTSGIIGRNGAGKSNTVDALYYAMTGAVLGNATLEEYVNHGADVAEVTHTFEVDGTPGTITRTITAPRHESGRRIAAKSTASLKLGKEKAITGPKAVQAAMVGLLGIKKEALARHVFIAQDALNNLLFSTPAERMDGLIMLMPEVSMAEWIRGELAKELSVTPEIVVATSIASLYTVQDEKTHMLSAATTEKARLHADIAEKVAAGKDAHASMRNHQLAVEAEVIIANADKTLAQMQPELVAVSECSAAEDELAELNSKTGKIYADGDEARRVCSVYTSNKNNEVRRVELTEDKNAAEAVLHVLIKPVAPTIVPDMLVKARVDIATELRKLTDWLAVYKTGACPTCGKLMDVSAQQIEEIQKKYNDTVAADAELTKAYTSAQAGVAAYNRDMSVYTATVSRENTRLARALSEIAALPTVAEEITDADYAAAMATIAIQDSHRKATDVLTTKISKLKAQASAAKAKIKKASDDKEAATVNLKFKLGDSEIAEAQATISDADNAQAAYMAASGAVQRYMDELDTTEKMIIEAESVQAKADARNKYRSVLTSVRDILHRDNLPARLLAKKIFALQDGCNRFLQLFGTPFAFNVFNDMTMTCTMPSGHEVGIHRLSGGQRAVLSVCMRFAINELFSKSLGLVVLDEPTASMDSDNVIAMRGLFEQIHAVSLKTGVQTIAITHHAEMLGAFDTVIEV
jgi:DNA repair exonuclease SbcCD ATPase subunit